jgi:hypothetical protein
MAAATFVGVFAGGLTCWGMGQKRKPLPAYRIVMSTPLAPFSPWRHHSFAPPSCWLLWSAWFHSCTCLRSICHIVALVVPDALPPYCVDCGWFASHANLVALSSSRQMDALLYVVRICS